MGAGRHAEGFDGAAAVTRSLLGYGVIAGAFYLVVGLALALTREGFELTSHALSLLMLGERGWLQRANIIVTGAMTLAAAVGFARALAPSAAGRRAGVLLGVYGIALVTGGLFPPDPMGGFPPGSTQDATITGVLHLAAGGIGFLALAGTALTVAGWIAATGSSRGAALSRAAAVVILAGFLGGAALATSTVGVLLLWCAVVVGWVWLAAASIWTYRTVPHPDADRRATTT
jgi:hypothetical membrane protein